AEQREQARGELLRETARAGHFEVALGGRDPLARIDRVLERIDDLLLDEPAEDLDVRLVLGATDGSLVGEEVVGVRDEDREIGVARGLELARLLDLFRRRMQPRR